MNMKDFHTEVQNPGKGALAIHKPTGISVTEFSKATYKENKTLAVEKLQSKLNQFKKEFK